MGRVPDEAGVDIERRMHPIPVQHSQSLVCVGIAIVKLNSHNCLYYSRGLRVIEHQEQAPGDEGCHKDHACVPGYAASNLCLHLVPLQAAICHANANGEVAVRSTAGSSVDQDWTLS